MACLIGGQVFAEKKEEVQPKDENKLTTEEAVIITEAAKQQAAEVIEKLQKDGLTPEQILEKVEVVLQDNDDSTESAYNSILNNKKYKEKLVWIVVGAVAYALIREALVPYAVKPLYEKITKSRTSGTSDPGTAASAQPASETDKEKEDK